MTAATGAPTVVVVGASLAGLRAAEQLRAAGHTGSITVFGAEDHPPYNRPPLSKDVLADPELTDAEAMLGRLTFRRRASTADVDFRLGVEVTGANLAARTLELAGADQVGFDGLVVATGLRPRRLTLPGPAAGRHVLRSLADCLELKGALTQVTAGRIVVIGAGFIGCETACTLAALGHRVTVVEPTGAPMNRVLGAELAAGVQRHHETAGIDFVIGPGVAGFTGDERVTGVELSDGTHLPAELVIESVGSACNSEWLAGNEGLDLSDGVLVDNHLEAAPAVVAVGDVARFPNPLFDDIPRRVEHWSIPTDTAKRAAATLTARLRGDALDPTPFAPIPSFWSDQGALRFQSFGSPALADEVRFTEGDPAALLDGVLASYLRDGRVVGSIAINLPPARQRGMREELLALVPDPQPGGDQ